MRLNGLIVFVLASFVCLWSFVGQSDARVIVVGGKQPEATLAPAGAVVEFTSFKIRPGKNRGLELKKIVVEVTGFGSIYSIADFLVIAKESPGISAANTDRVVLSSSISSKDDILELINLPEDGGLPVFTKPVELTVAARMENDLDQYAGQVIYLTVKSIVLVRKKTGKEVKIRGKFPIVGAGHTINSTLKIGSLSMEAKEDFVYDITAGSEEPIGIRKIVMRANPSDEEGEPNSYSLYIEKTGEVFPFQREDNTLYIIFKEEQIVEKGETLKVQIKQDEGNLLWEILSLSPEDIEAYGYYYNYRIIPQWLAEG